MGSHTKTSNKRTFIRSAARGIASKVGSGILNKIFIFLIVGLRPLLGPALCRFSPTCGKYAVQQLQEKNVFVALWAIIKRLLSCNPFIN